jgi:hypothetical protein
MFALIRPVLPLACEAFLDYEFEAMSLSRAEVEAIRAGDAEPKGASRGELTDWAAKKARLGL